tara:strand:- start:1315 stop:1875 length:561 start_codon:yes stop_codon:yes gene_type:complete
MSGLIGHEQFHGGVLDQFAQRTNPRHISGGTYGSYGIHDTGRLLETKTFSFQSNLNFSGQLSIKYFDISTAGHVFVFRFYASMKALNDGSTYAEINALYRSDFGGLIYNRYLNSKLPRGSTAGGVYDFYIDNPGTGANNSTVGVRGTLTSGGSASWDVSVLVTVHAIDTRNSAGVVFHDHQGNYNY